MELEIIKAIDYSDNGDYKIAIDICTEILKSNLDYDRAYFERAMAYLNLDKDNLAINDFKKLMQINPDYPGARDWYSKTLSRLGDFRASADMKLLELKNSPEGKYGMGVSPQSWAECADAFYKAREVEKAEEVLNGYFNEHIEKVDKYICYETAPSRVLTEIFIDTGRFQQALNESTKMMKSVHKAPIDYELFIESLILNGQTEKASTKIESYVENIQGGYISDNIIRLKLLIEKSK